MCFIKFRKVLLISTLLLSLPFTVYAESITVPLKTGSTSPIISKDVPKEGEMIISSFIEETYVKRTYLYVANVLENKRYQKGLIDKEIEDLRKKIKTCALYRVQETRLAFNTPDDPKNNIIPFPITEKDMQFLNYLIGLLESSTVFCTDLAVAKMN